MIDMQKLYKIGGRRDDENNTVVEKYVLIDGAPGKGVGKKEIQRQISRFKKESGVGSPRDFVKFINRKAAYMEAEIVNDPISLHGLEHS